TLRTVLKRKNQEQKEEQVEAVEDMEMPANPRRKISWKRLFIAGSTSGSAGVILLAMVVLYSQAGVYIPESVYSQTYECVIQSSLGFMIRLAALALIFIYVAGIAGNMIKYVNFIIEQRDKELFIKRGLLETKELPIPFDRILAIQIDQSIIPQPFKFVQ